MKKFILCLMILFMGSSSFAVTATDVRQFFSSFVDAANSYNPDYFDYYMPNATISRVVEKKDGSTKIVYVPMTTYRKHSKLNSRIGKLRHYKNYYSEIKIVQNGEDFKLSAMRRPSTSDYKLPVYFVIGPNSQGHLKIKEESMHTKVQAFLRH